MRFRKLRIAFSATSLIACMLLIVLWVRSNTWRDEVRGPLFGYTEVQLISMNSDCSFILETDNRDTDWGLSSYDLTTPPFLYGPTMSPPSFLGIGGVSIRHGYYILAPHWFTAAVAAALAIVPWLRWRFSLRTLLIATTLVAVVLGLIAWLER